MAKITLAFGAALIVLGVLSFVLTGSQHYTALIPAVFGIVFGVCGTIALNPKYRMHTMHATVLLGLIGFLATIGSIAAVIKISTGAEIIPPEGRTIESVRGLPPLRSSSWPP